MDLLRAMDLMPRRTICPVSSQGLPLASRAEWQGFIIWRGCEQTLIRILHELALLQV
jgi:hypothetical protein